MSERLERSLLWAILATHEDTDGYTISPEMNEALERAKAYQVAERDVRCPTCLPTQWPDLSEVFGRRSEHPEHDPERGWRPLDERTMILDEALEEEGP